MGSRSSRGRQAARLAVSIVVLAAAWGCKEETPTPPQPPPDVKVATVLQKDVPIYLEAIGQTRGAEEVEVRARVEGYLMTVDFVEGTFVRKGQALDRSTRASTRRPWPRPRAASPRRRPT